MWIILIVLCICTIVFIFVDSKKTSKLLKANEEAYELAKFNSNILANRKANKGVRRKDCEYVNNAKTMLSSKSFTTILNTPPKCANR